MAINYQNFDLIIERAYDAKGNGYRVRFDAPTGNSTVDFTVPFSPLELKTFVHRLNSLNMESMKGFGGRLFRALFTDQVGAAFSSSRYEAISQGEGYGLRVRLLLTEVPELAPIPWEYLYDPASNKFLSLSVKTPIVRYLNIPQIDPPVKIKPPLRILVMMSNPYDYPALDVAQESQKLRAALSLLEKEGLVVVECVEAATLSALQQKLREQEYHIFHFIGHGVFDRSSEQSYLIFENAQHAATPVSGQELGILLHDERLRMAVLNACDGGRASGSNSFAGVAQSLVQKGIPAVIAMQFAISDKAAIGFTHEFYSALAGGYTVDGALSEARKAIVARSRHVEWGAPVLYLSASNEPIFNFNLDPPIHGLQLSNGLQPSNDPLLALHNLKSDQSEQTAPIAVVLNEAKSAMKRQQWKTATNRWQAILDLEPTHPEAAAQLEVVRLQQKWAAFYKRGQKQFNTGNWTAASAALRQVPEVAPHYHKAQDLIATIERPSSGKSERSSRRRSSWYESQAKYWLPMIVALLFVIIVFLFLSYINNQWAVTSSYTVPLFNLGVNIMI